jgi:hypothetical protein
MESGRIRKLDPVAIWPGIGAGSLIVLLALWTGCFGFAAPAQAEVRVSGGADAVTIETQEATLEQVLAALRASFRFRYRSTAALDRVINGTYSGSLSRVIARLLEDQSYVIQSSQNELAVVILGPSRPAQVAGPVGPAASRAAGAAPPPAPTEPLKECIYKDGDRVIPVEC